MEAETPIDAEDEEAHVVAQSHTRAEGHVFEYPLELERRLLHLVVLLERPHVAHVEEGRAIERSHKMRAVF